MHWNTSGVSDPDRFDAWHEILNRTHMPWSMRRFHNPSFFAEVRSLETGTVDIVDCRCDPCSGYRDAPRIRGSDSDRVGILVLRKGHERLRQGDHAIDLVAGSVVVWDATRPIEFEIRSAIEKCTLFIPKDLFLQTVGMAKVPVGIIDGSRGFGALFRKRVDALAEVMCDFDRVTGRQLGTALVRDISSALSGPARIVPPRQALLQRAEQIVEANFRESSFGPRDLACRLGVSTRYLHQVFHGASETVAKRILSRRLDAVRSDLDNPQLAEASITHIGFARGFSSAEHLSRAFRSRFGSSPTAYRRRDRSAGTAGNC